jgi:flagellin
MEADQLLDELDRISNTTEYNTRKLLSGALGIIATEDLSKLSSSAQSFGSPNAVADSSIIKKSNIYDDVTVHGIYTIRLDTVLSDADFANAKSSPAVFPNINSSTIMTDAFNMQPDETETLTFIQEGTDKVARVTLKGSHTISEAINDLQRQLDYEGLLIDVSWDPSNGNGSFSFTAQKRGTLYDFSINASNSTGNNPNTDNAIFDMDHPLTISSATGQDISVTVFAPDGSIENLTSDSSEFKSDILNTGGTLFDNVGKKQGIFGLSFELDIDSRGKNGVQNYIAGMEVSGIMQFQVGSEQGFDNRINLNINSTSTNSLGISKLDISSQESAMTLIDSENIDSAISLISNYRSNLGAVQNRLEHSISNIMINKENLGYAESRIRDTDIASETTTFTKEQIMQQAGTAMLAQANQITQSTLQLLG